MADKPWYTVEARSYIGTSLAMHLNLGKKAIDSWLEYGAKHSANSKK